MMSLLERVNAKVNADIRPLADGAVDIWSVNVRAGDCEDYVMTKRHALIGAGVPASALRIAWVKTRQGEQHAVLVVKTNDHDGLVLDNLTGRIRTLSQTGYSVLSISGADPKVWS
jgi:predicted transglutaminase-like cysteine proteinase